MRILVISNLPPYVLGGAENQVFRLVCAWQGAGAQVEVAGHRLPNGSVRTANRDLPTHRIFVVNRLGRLGRSISYFLSLACLLLRHSGHFDIIYCRGLADGALSICLLKSLGLLNVPLVACPINAKGAGDVSFIKSIPGWRWLVRMLNRHCNGINIIAPAIEPDLASVGITAPAIARIPNGIALSAPVKRSSVSATRQLIWTGRLSKQKGLVVMMRALACVRASGRDFHLQLIGDGPERLALERLSSELGIADRIEFIGAIDREQIRARLHAADVFLLPSIYEGMSNSALEAMEAGLPVLLTRCGGIDTYVDEALGWVCPPDDECALSQSLCAALDAEDGELLARGACARALVERRFAIEDVAAANLAFFARILLPAGE
ncbi:glycosyltransferase family 4 protein [Niveibacterium terrae]|uniref:glycosyltransferase family 4 protein n=1 Tax=Niveibacterium terrae TaxID=3373598 RepID=UPI003A8D9F79